MKEILLSQGKVALVEDNDFDGLSLFKWSAMKNRSTFYAFRKDGGAKSGKNIYMHREILNAPKDTVVDHIDGNGLNNRRKNIRLVSHRENTSNRARNRRNPLSLGTSFRKAIGKYTAQIKLNGRIKYLGSFDEQELAHEAYMTARLALSAKE